MGDFLSNFDLRKPKKNKFDPFDNLFSGDFSAPLLDKNPDTMFGPPAPNAASKLDTGAVDSFNYGANDPMFAEPRTEDYLSHLTERPKHEEYKSSFGRKLGGGLLGALLGTDLGVTNKPYNEALQKWSDAGPGLKEGAQFEQKGLNVRRQRLNDLMRNQRANRDYQRKVDQANAEHEIALKRIETIKDANEQKKQELEERRRHFDRMMQYRTERDAQTIPLQARRTSAYEQSVANRTDKTLSGNEQMAIDKEAQRMVASDPRFAKFYDVKVGGFGDIVEKDPVGNDVIDPKTKAPKIKERMDETTQKMLTRALAVARERVANKKRSQYSSPYGFDSLDWEMMSGQDNNPMDFLKDEQQQP